ncbi:alpha/beta hydrolase [bacterium]|nr:alpha/beta hydrolase [bacterium]
MEMKLEPITRQSNGLSYIYSPEGFWEEGESGKKFWPACDYPKTKKRFVEKDQTIFWVEQEGEGPPLVLVHGGPGVDHRYFHPCLFSLAEKRRLIYYDLRAHGMSPESSPARPHGVMQDADDLDTLRLALGLERIDLLGHSYGGLVILAYAQKRPRNAGSLILASVPLGETEEEIDRRIELAPITKKMQEAGSEDEYDKLYYEFYYHKPPPPDVVRYNKLSMESYNIEKNKALLKSYESDNISLDYKGIFTALAVPVLIIAGKHDLIVNIEAIREVIVCSDIVDFKVYEESGHDPFVDEHERFTSDVSEFLSRTDRDH